MTGRPMHPGQRRPMAWALAVAWATCVPLAHADNERVAGKLLFNQRAVPACAVCHTLRDAGSEGAVGPNLDELQPDAQRVANAVRQGLGNMPAFRDSLSEQEIDALARYVSATAGR